MDLNKKFSIAHHDNCPDPDQYLEAMRNSSPAFRDELYDIYFGKKFRYQYREKETYDSYSRLHEVNYGNVMGVEASDEQVDNLFRIQNELKIPISLTVNQLNVPIEIYYSKDDRVFRAFVDWLQEFYDRGLRICTLSNNHLMRSGILQSKFPDMIWKNTVNQNVTTAQQVLDYLHLGYNIIQLDRSLNRNMEELKRTKEVVENFKNKYPGKYVKTCMLVCESCMPSCPFKREHDDVLVYYRTIDYRRSHLGDLSCLRWASQLADMSRPKWSKFGATEIPRFGTNCYWPSIETFGEFAELVDIFKYSGRYDNKVYTGDPGNIKFGWATTKHASGSFSEIIENKLEPLSNWGLTCRNFAGLETNVNNIKADLAQDDFWMTEKARKLEQKLKTCRNQCYGCHLCEGVMGLPAFDSLVEF